MKLKHTPGPWTLHEQYGSVDSEALWAAVRQESESDRTIVEVKGHHHGVPFEEYIANVKLVVAAPDMLDALESIDQFLQVLGADQTHPNILAIKAVIKKATE